MSIYINYGNFDKNLKKIRDIDIFLDPVIKTESLKMQSELIRTTNVKTGTTQRNWTKPIREKASSYFIANRIRTFDNKELIVNILNDGRGPIKAKAGKKLYIPLSPKGSKKLPGAKIPASFKYGIDYILKKEVGPFKGTKFIEKAVHKIGGDVDRKILQHFKLHGII